MSEPDISNELSTAILAVYRGPLEGFVSRRDALVKQLRASKDREAAERVKALRKPSRMAWVLDSVAHEDPSAIAQLEAAIGEAQAGADLRTALETVKAAVRGVAAVGARAAVRAGHPIEPNAVIAAVHAVIGDAAAFAELRAGLLAEVPEGGGLDMLAATVREQPIKATSPSPALPDPQEAKTEARVDAARQLAEAAKQQAEAAKQQAEAAKAARAALQRAEVSLGELAERSQLAEQSVLHAQKKLDAAEHTVLHAQAEAETRRADLERVAKDAAAATAALRDAELAVAAARASVSSLRDAT